MLLELANMLFRRITCPCRRDDSYSLLSRVGLCGGLLILSLKVSHATMLYKLMTVNAVKGRARARYHHQRGETRSCSSPDGLIVVLKKPIPKILYQDINSSNSSKVNRDVWLTLASERGKVIIATYCSLAKERLSFVLALVSFVLSTATFRLFSASCWLIAARHCNILSVHLRTSRVIRLRSHFVDTNSRTIFTESGKPV